MSRNNRVLNRIILLLAAVCMLTAGVIALFRAFFPDMFGEAAARVEQLWPEPLMHDVATPWALTVPVWVIVLGAAALLILAISIVFLASRRRGTTRTVLRSESSRGTTSADVSTAGEFFEHRLISMPQLLGVSTTVYRLRREEAILLELFVRDGSNLSDVLAAAHEALGDWDRISDTSAPVILRLGRQRIRDRFRSPMRAR